MKTVFRRCFVLLLAVMLTLGCGTTALAADDSDTFTVQVQATYGQTEARSMLEMINEFRTGDEAWYWNSDNTTKTQATGLQALSYDYTLEQAAMQRAAEIALSFQHTRPDGTSCFTAVTEEGYIYVAAGENIAAGYTTAEAVMDGWKETNKDYSGQGHRRNMLSASYTSVGIGHVVYNGVHYWVQEFGKSYTGMNSTVTTANDSVTAVDVNIASSQITSASLSSDTTALSLELGKSANLPDIAASIQLVNAWPSRASSVTVTPAWSVMPASIAEITDGQLSANAIGSATLTAAALGTTLSIPVTVTPISIGTANVTLSQTSYTYAGTAREPAVTVTVNGITLAQGTDYTVAYSDNKNVGTATVTVTGIGNYTGTAKATFTIKPADLTACTATLSAASYTYSGSAKKPAVTVRTAKGTKLTEGTNYQVSYTDNVNAGTATVTITGINNYAGTIVQHFTIQKASLSACTVKRGDTTRVVNGVTVPNVVVTTAKGTKLKEGTNYSVSYTVENGVGVATVTGINNYTGTKTLTFAPLTDINQGTVTMSFTIATYSGNQKRPAVTVKDANGNTLKKGQDYTVTYQNTTNVGKGKVIITGIGDYCGTVTKTLTIRPKAPTDLQIVSTTKTTAKISFTRDTTADKYYIYVDGKYVGAALTVDYYTIKGLTSGTTYKVTVKAVKVVDGSNIYSLSSSTLTVKTK